MLTKVPIEVFAKVGAGQGAPQMESDFSEEGIPFIRAGHLQELLNGKDEMLLPKINKEIAAKYKLKLYPPGSVIFAKSGMSATKGRIYKLKNPCYIVNHLAILEINDKAYADYILYSLRKFSPVKLINDPAYPSIGLETIKKYSIPFFERLEDQIRIANVLSQAEDLITKRKESIQLLDELLKSTFLDMFGDPVRNEKGWEKQTLKDVCSKITDGTHHSPPIVDEGIPYITAKHVRPNKIDFWANPWFVSKEMHDAIYKRCNPKKGDILYIKDGATTGISAINKYDFEFSMLSSLALLRPDKNVLLPEFLNAWLNNDMVKTGIISKMAGGAIKRLTLTKINALPILVPPILLQTQFAQIVEKVENIKTKYQASLQELENLYASLSQKAFKGELDLSKMEIEHEKLDMAAEEGVGYGKM
ncbi:restriction endonuclease subunit S [Bacteroidota bacterium]